MGGQELWEIYGSGKYMAATIEATKSGMEWKLNAINYAKNEIKMLNAKLKTEIEMERRTKLRQ